MAKPPEEFVRSLERSELNFLFILSFVCGMRGQERYQELTDVYMMDVFMF